MLVIDTWTIAALLYFVGFGTKHTQRAMNSEKSKKTKRHYLSPSNVMHKENLLSSEEEGSEMYT